MEPVFASPGVPPRPRSRGALLGAALRRPGGRRALSVLSIVLALAGIAMFAFPAYTDLIAHFRQGHLKSEFSSPELQEAYKLHKFTAGQALTRLTSKRMGIDVLVVEGTTPSALKAGAGHYPETPLPCEAGNVGIAGHRTTYGRPFNKIDTMKAGDIVDLETPFETCHYVVVPGFSGHGNPWTVQPNDFGVVSPPSPATDKWLTLTSCHPKGSARERIVLRLKWVGTDLKKTAQKSSSK
jgi:sortase A